MRYHSLFWASFLPTAIVAQSGKFVGSGSAHPTGLPYPSNTTTKWNSTYPIPQNGSTNSSSEVKPHPTSSGVTTKLPTEIVSTLPSGTGRLPFSVGSDAHFANGTASGKAGPTNAGGFPHASGTGPSSGIAKARGPEGSTSVAAEISFLSSSSASSLISPTGRLPVSKSSGYFVNSTTGGAVRPTASGFIGHASGTGASSGFAKPTQPSRFMKPAANSSASSSATGRLPFTKSAGFFNSTSGVAKPTGTGYAPYSGSGLSSGFAKPTGQGNYTTPALNTKPALVSTGRLPVKSTSSVFYGNSTVPSSAGPTVVGSSGVLPAKPFPTGISLSGVAASSGRLPYIKSSGLVFANSTSGTIPLPTGFASPSAVSSGSLQMSPHSSGPYVTGTGYPISKPSATANATSSGLSSSNSSFTSLATGKVQVPTASSNATIPLSTGVLSSAPSASATTLITRASASGIPTSSTSSGASPSVVVVPEYYQCGGLNWEGSTSCAEGMVCKKWNPYYSQCVDERYA